MNVADSMILQLQWGCGQPPSLPAQKPGGADQLESFQTLLRQTREKQISRPREEKPTEGGKLPADTENEQPVADGDEAQMDLYRQMLAAQSVMPMQAVLPVDTAPVQSPLPQLEAVQTVQPQAVVPQNPVAQTVIPQPQAPAEAAVPMRQAVEAPQQVRQEGIPVQANQMVGQAEVRTGEAPTPHGGEQSFQPQDGDGTQKQELTQTTGELGQARPLFQRVESTVIKVGNAPQAEPSDLEQQVSKPVAAALGRGESRVEIHLTPENLGTVTVEMTRGQDGALRVALHATGERAASLLEKHASGLESLLMSSTQGTVHVEVQRQQESQPSQQNPYEQERQGQQQHPQDRQQDDRQRQPRSQEFLQQLRLGLIPRETAS